MKSRSTSALLVGLVVVLAACSSPGASQSSAPSESQGSVPSCAQTENPTGSPAASELSLTIQQTTKGDALAGADGLTLYTRTDEVDGTIHCGEGCVGNWPPLTGTVDAGDANADMLGTITRPDDTEQVTYNGYPLYYFTGDAAPGDATGDALGGVWFIAAPSGEH